MIERRDTFDQLTAHADHLGEARLAGAGVMGAWWYVNPQDIVLYLTIIYLLLQICVILPKWFAIVRMWLGKRKKRRFGDE